MLSGRGGVSPALSSGSRLASWGAVALFGSPTNVFGAILSGLCKSSVIYGSRLASLVLEIFISKISACGPYGAMDLGAVILSVTLKATRFGFWIAACGRYGSGDSTMDLRIGGGYFRIDDIYDYDAV